VREGGAQAGVRSRSTTGDRGAGQERVRRAARPLVPKRAPAGRGGLAPGTRARAVPPLGARAPAGRARIGLGRPRTPALVPLHARALAADTRRREARRPRVSRRVRRPGAYAIVVAACALPRAAVLVHERDAVMENFEKSILIARVFVKSGTFGYIPGEPTAYTQPLYAWFLIAIDWIAGLHWWSVGTAQILVAAATALLVYEVGRRSLSPGIGLIAALIATLQPYLVWHDVHGNREILDQLLGVAMFALALAVRSPVGAA